METARDTDQGDARLRELGFDPDASPDTAVATLESLREQHAADDAAIARALSRINTADAAAMLAGMEAGATGAERREVRRALFRLRQHGIVPPADAAGRATNAPEHTPADAGLSALLSPIDPEGVRIVWLLKSRNTGGLRRLWGLVSANVGAHAGENVGENAGENAGEIIGLFGVNLTALTRKEFRAERADFEHRSGVKLFDADWHLADFILCDAYRRTPEATRGRVGNFLAIRAELIGAPPPLEFEHPIYREFLAQAADEPSVELMREPEIGGWKLPADQVKPFADEIAGLQESVIVLSPVQNEERANLVIERAIAELLADERGDHLRRYLEETAYYFARTGRRQQAGWAAAAAARLLHHEDPRRIPFFQAFMRAQLGALIAEKQQHQREEPRLIMTPAEAMRSQQAARARTRPRP